MLEIRKIPKTSYNKYISGWYALNTPKDGYTADWHPLLYWSANNDKDVIELTDNYFLGNKAIEYRDIKWSDKKEYIASYPRAIADLVYYSEDPMLYYKYIINDMLGDDDRLNAFKLLLEVSKHKDIHEFMIHEFPIEYTKYLKEINYGKVSN